MEFKLNEKKKDKGYTVKSTHWIWKEEKIVYISYVCEKRDL